MNLQPYRNSFSVVVADSHVSRGGEVVNALSNAGYPCEYRVNLQSLRTELLKNPPHLIVLHFDDTAFFKDGNAHQALIAELIEALPEVKIVILANVANFGAACELYQWGVYDCLIWPSAHPRQLLQAVDRAVETCCYIYLNEQLRGGAENSGGSVKSFAMFEMWMKELATATSREEMITLWMKEAMRVLGTDAALYMTYLESKKSLVATKAIGWRDQDIKNIGLDLEREEPGFEPRMMKQPASLRCLNGFVKNGLMREQAAYFPLTYKNKSLGIFILPARRGQVYADDVSENDYLKGTLHILRDRFEKLDDRNRLNRFSVYDEVSEAYSTAFILRKLNEEISRSRRLLRPVALLHIRIDAYEDLALAQSEEAMTRFLKAFADILIKNSRMSDLVGRLSRDTFLLCLPHTDKRGAIIKGERLRRLMERADFSAVLGGLTRLTVSVGISEYPSLCRDADDLLKTSEAVTTELKRSGKNKIGIAAAPASFVPDFVVSDAKNISTNGR